MTVSRKETYEVGLMAWQAGLTPNEAARAIQIGARILAHGITTSELDKMIQWLAERRADQALNEIGLNGGAPRW